MGRASKYMSDREVQAIARLRDALSALVDRLGIAFVVLIAIVWTIKLLATAKTQDDFIREVLFGESTGGRSLAIFFAGMVVTATFGLDSMIRQRVRDNADYKRILEENRRWQERAIRAEHGHVDEGLR
jgi:hypothetical protein